MPVCKSSTTLSKMSSCGICCESFNKSSRKPISCAFCAYESCIGCTKEYLLGTTQDPHCMNCRKAWGREFMDITFPKVFVNTEYKKHREVVLIDRERSQLPATMPYVEVLSKVNKINKEIVLAKERLIGSVQLFEVYITSATTVDDIERRAKADADYYERKMQINYLQKLRSAIESSGKKREFCEVRKFVRACPAESCRGFLSSQWKCGLCDVWACPDCHEVIGHDKAAANHVCKPENVESAKLIDKDSRPCPKCASMIFKIEGCDQMYCVQCSTPFSWKTGKVESGRIHNPHYYEMLRKNGGNVPREVGDEVCGGVPTGHVLAKHAKDLSRGKDDGKVVMEAVRLYNHNQDVLQRVPVVPVNNQDLRAKFLMSEIDEDKFKKLLQQREKKHDKQKEMQDVLTMFNTALGDMLRRFVQTTTAADAKRVTKEMDELRVYTNECYEKIAKRFKCLAPKIDAWAA